MIKAFYHGWCKAFRLLAPTYVMCVDEENETFAPMYIEPEIIVSPYPLPANRVVNPGE